MGRSNDSGPYHYHSKEEGDASFVGQASRFEEFAEVQRGKARRLTYVISRLGLPLVGATAKGVRHMFGSVRGSRGAIIVTRPT
jgi:hypothetical protein